VNPILSVFIFVIFASWLSVLSLLFYFVEKRKKQAEKELFEVDVKKSVIGLLEAEARVDKQLKSIKATLEQCIQKVGVARFNPFGETGGMQSFSVALLDKKDNGVVITSLHSRGGTRTYAKVILSGKAEQGLSIDEQKAIQLAKVIHE
jgi:hypothetical protein